MPPDIGNCKRLLTQRCSRPGLYLSWCRLSIHSLAAKHLMTDGENLEKQWTAKILRKRLLLWFLWCALTVVFSTVAVVYQVGKSTPGFLPAGRVWSLGLKACIGTSQAVVSNFIMPSVASRVTWERNKHAFTTVANLIMNWLIPFAIIMYLDTGCLGRWVALWKPCRSSRELFQHSFICTSKNQRDCPPGMYVLAWEIDIMLVRGGDICDPHHSWSSASMSNCMHISLLRLQEILLAKFVTTGVVMPGIALIRNELPAESSAVLAQIAIHMAYAMVSSGHLPLMMPILLLAFLAEGLVARVAWAEGRCKAGHAQNVAAPALKMTRLLSMMVHLASVAGDQRILAMAGAYICMLVTAYPSNRPL